jgi:hypothetical protein
VHEPIWQRVNASEHPVEANDNLGEGLNGGSGRRSGDLVDGQQLAEEERHQRASIWATIWRAASIRRATETGAARRFQRRTTEMDGASGQENQHERRCRRQEE